MVRYALRDMDSGLFYSNRGIWTDDIWLAKEFESEGSVREMAIQIKVKNAEMVCVEGDPPGVICGVRIRFSETTRK